MPRFASSEPRMLRLTTSLYALVALALLLPLAWLRFFVPSRHARAHVRDITLLPPRPPGR